MTDLSFQEADFDLCKQCYVKLMKPPKKTVKKIILTMYQAQCKECGKQTRLVEYTWENEDND